MRKKILLLIFGTYLHLIHGTCDLPKVKNGYGRRKPGDMIKYFCRKGYYLVGDRISACRKGHWTNPAPHCIASGCPIPITVRNGRAIPSRDDALLTFECDVGYVLVGREHAYCDGHAWTRLPTCKVPSDLNGCDFENSNLCGWIQDSKDEFDWTRKAGPTTTARTGPSYDHTFGPSKLDGHYIYIETSTPRKLDDTARLISPLYPAQKSGRCFSFWYHMLGPPGRNEVGVLQIKLRRQGQSEDILFEIEGNQGMEWKRGIVYVDRMASSFELVISATRKLSYVGDIAVDDVKFVQCEDLPLPDTSTTTDFTTSYNTDVTHVSNDASVKYTTEVGTAETTQSTGSSKTTATTTQRFIQKTSTTITTGSTKQSYNTTDRPNVVETTQQSSTIDKDISKSVFQFKTTTKAVELSTVSEEIDNEMETTSIYRKANMSISSQNGTSELKLSTSSLGNSNLSKKTGMIILGVALGTLVAIVFSVLIVLRVRRKRKRDKKSFDDLHNAHAVYRKTSTDILIK